MKSTIIFLLIPLFYQTAALLTDAELWEEAHKSLVRKTREYIKENPISDELREFIQRVKGIHKSDASGKAKRQDTRNMYAVKDGEVVPINELSNGELNTESELGANFTVVPLIIHVPLEHNVTLSTSQPKDDIKKEDDTQVNSNAGILGRGYNKPKGNKEDCNESEGSTTEETVFPAELIEARMRSTTETSELGKMLDDMEQLINTQKRGKPSKEGSLCNINGYWDSEAGGKTIHIYNNHSDTDNHTAATMFNKDPPVDEGFLINDKWNTSAQLPFPHTAQVILVATTWKGRKVAIFTGECRICEGSETITGDWMIGRTSTSCKDQKASHSFFSDVFRKNNVPALQNDHFKKINMTPPKPPEDNTQSNN